MMLSSVESAEAVEELLFIGGIHLDNRGLVAFVATLQRAVCIKYAPFRLI
jgi:hypothetical protein